MYLEACSSADTTALSSSLFNKDAVERRWRDDLRHERESAWWSCLSPKVSATEDDRGTQFMVALPGVDGCDIELAFVGGMLTLKALCAHAADRSAGLYFRRFGLPFEADRDRVRAQFVDETLTITVPYRRGAKDYVQPVAVRAA